VPGSGDKPSMRPGRYCMRRSLVLASAVSWAMSRLTRLTRLTRMLFLIADWKLGWESSDQPDSEDSPVVTASRSNSSIWSPRSRAWGEPRKTGTASSVLTWARRPCGGGCPRGASSQ
jgi:hypothetical protein